MKAHGLEWGKKAGHALWLSGAVFAFMAANDDNGCAPESAERAAQAECQVDSDCKGDPGVDCVGAWSCQTGQCEFECGNPPVETGCFSDSDCSEGLVCNAGVVCHSPPGCGPNDACDAVCYGDCVKPEPPDPTACTSSGQCPEGQYCTTESGVCNSNCAEGMSCPAVCWGDCKPRENGAICYSDSECALGQVCDRDPCVFPEASSDAADRIACGGVCSEREGCNGPNDCAAGEVCACAAFPGDAPANGLMPCFLQCQPAEGACATDSDCKEGLVCQAGLCVEPQRECTDDAQCPRGWACQSSCNNGSGGATPTPDGDAAMPYCPSYCAPQGGTCADTGVTCGPGETCVNECYTVCPDCACADGEACDCGPCYEECRSGCVPDQGGCNDQDCPAGTHCGCPDGVPTPANGLYYCEEKCIQDTVPTDCYADWDCGDGYYCAPGDCTTPTEPCDPAGESCDADRPAPACPGTCQVKDPGYDCKSDANCISPNGEQGFCKYEVCDAGAAFAPPCDSDNDPNCGVPAPLCYGYCVYEQPVSCDPAADTCPDGTHCDQVGGCGGAGAGFMPCLITYQCVPDQQACATDCDCDPSLACSDGVCQRMGRINICGLNDCTEDSQCAEGQYCNIDYTQPVCDCAGCPCSIPHGTCQEKPADGSCDSDADCAAGQTCTMYYPPCAPPPDEFAVPPSCDPIGVCEDKGCRPTGCAGTVCSDTDDLTTSTCEWFDYYQCYKFAICDYGGDGTCGWQKTDDFIACMERYPAPE